MICKRPCVFKSAGRGTKQVKEGIAIKFKIKREDNVDTKLILSSHFYYDAGIME